MKAWGERLAHDIPRVGMLLAAALLDIFAWRRGYVRYRANEDAVALYCHVPPGVVGSR
jgi:hypothetical protein